MSKLVITFDINEDVNAEQLLKYAKGLLFTEHPWIPGGFFSDVLVKEVFLARAGSSHED